MFEIRNGRYYFILIDFDMAVYLGDAGKGGTYRATSKNRTGTLPFMACELILDAAAAVRAASTGEEWVPIPHLLRHDFESLFHVSYWCATAIKRAGDPESLTKILEEDSKDMETGKLQVLGERRELLCIKGIRTLSKKLNILRPWFNQWADFFSQVCVIRQSNDRKRRDFQMDPTLPKPPPFDNETVNGLFTRDTLKAALVIPAASLHRLTHPVESLAPEAPATSDSSVETEPGPSEAAAKSTKGRKPVQTKGLKATVAESDATKGGAKKTARNCAQNTLEPEQRSEESKRYCSRLRSSDKK